MNNQVQLFNYNHSTVRVVMLDGEPWWVAKDVCNILGIANSRDAISALEDDERMNVGNSDIGPLLGLNVSPTLYPKGLNLINESGLYVLIIRSNKPEAKIFRKWITSEVLPTIRKTGSYSSNMNQQIETLMSDPNNWIKILQAYADEKEKAEKLSLANKELARGNDTLRKDTQIVYDWAWNMNTYNNKLESKIAVDAPKVAFAEVYEVSPTSISIGDYAKVLKDKGLEVGRDRLFEWFRDTGHLIKQHGIEFNSPKQYDMERRWFEIKIYFENMEDPDNAVMRKTTLITEKGQLHFTPIILNSYPKWAQLKELPNRWRLNKVQTLKKVGD